MNSEIQLGPLLSAEPSEDWENEISAFEREDRSNPPRKGAVVFAGSSTFTFWTDMEKDFAPIPVIRRGFGGSLISDVLRYANRVIIPYAPKQVVIYAGENDIGAGRMPRDIFHDYHRLVDLIRASLPKTQVSYISIRLNPDHLPYKDAIRVTNHLIAAYTKDHPLTDYIDAYPLTLDKSGHPRGEFYADGLHLNRQGYELWIPVIKAALVE